MQDFVIETATPDEIQKHLRQWRHSYHIKIHHYSIVKVIDIDNVPEVGLLYAHIVLERVALD